MSESESASGEAAADAEAAGGGAKGGAIVVVEPDPAVRNLAEDLEDDLDRQVIAVDSTEFDTEAAEEILEASAYVINWNLGIRCGADLIEQVRNDPQVADKPVVIAMAAPTESGVRTALRLGADSICAFPYDGQELVERLAAIEARRKARDAA